MLAAGTPTARSWAQVRCRLAAWASKLVLRSDPATAKLATPAIKQAMRARAARRTARLGVIGSWEGTSGAPSTVRHARHGRAMTIRWQSAGPGPLRASPSLDVRDRGLGGDDVSLPHVDRGHGSRPVGNDVVLHLHGLEDGDDIPDLDPVPGLHGHLEDQALHGSGDRARANQRRAREARRGHAPGGGRPGTEDADVVGLPVDLDPQPADLDRRVTVGRVHRAGLRVRRPGTLGGRTADGGPSRLVSETLHRGLPANGGEEVGAEERIGAQRLGIIPNALPGKIAGRRGKSRLEEVGRTAGDRFLAPVHQLADVGVDRLRRGAKETEAIVLDLLADGGVAVALEDVVDGLRG